ncbi:MAG: D-glycero-beta-D-manno-heptose 1-phosphate adenylyltransferase, partial [Bacteriovoracaceae bacterium]
TPLSLILKIKPNILVKGGDWKIDQIVGAKEVIASGGEVFSLNFVDGYSTTSIITKIQGA